MSLNRRSFIASAAAAAVGAPALAQSGYPNRQISVVVGAAPGGPNDIVARQVSERLSQRLGVPIVIENKPGASGFIAATDVKAAAPDGYRLLFAYTGLLAVNPWLFKSLPYDPARDFAPVSLVTRIPNVLLVSPQLGVKTYAELVSWLRANPKEAAYGSAGIGTPLHIGGELFLAKAGVRAVHIPYKGSSPAYADLLSGRIHFIFDGIPGVLGYLKGGQMLALASTGASRHPLLPNTPTLSEVGVKDAEVESWFGFAAPAGTPQPVVDRLSTSIVQVMQEPALRTRLQELGAQPWGTTPAEMAQHVERERERWKGLVASAGVQPRLNDDRRDPMAFLRNAWYVALWGQDLTPGAIVPRTVLGEPVVLFRSPEREARALFGICPHRFAPLHLGKLQPSGSLQCGYHGLQFDERGACVHNPHADQTPQACALRAYPVVEKHSIVWIWMGERPAQPELIPDFSFLDGGSQQLESRRDWLTMDASYRLVIDNLLDLSHVPFLHDGLLGNATTVKAEMRVEQRGREVFVSRDKFNAKPPGLLDKLFRDDGQPVDAWQTIRWSPPSALRNDSGICPVGGTREEGAGIFSAHLLTPIDEHRTMYHFAAVRQGVPLPPERDAQELSRLLSDLRRHAFEHQDEPMIEAQQEMMRLYPAFTAQPVLLPSDAGAVRANRLLDQWLAEEQAGR